MKERTFPHIQAGEAAGFKFELNPARLLEVRGHASIQARAKKAFDDEIASRYAAVDVPDTPPANWTPGGGGDVATELAPGITQARADWSNYPSKYLDDVQVSPQTREAVLRVHEQITPAMTSDGGMEAVIRLANTVTARWKALALASPGFHMRNMIDDAMRGYWAGGRNPKSYVDAGRLVAGKGAKVRLTIDGETLQGGQILNLAKALGIVDQGFSGKEVAAGLAETAGTIKKATTRVRTPGTGRIAQGSRRVGDFRENATRLGTFIERVKAGDTAYEAARITREFHMDYGDVGRFVEGARRFWLPFVTFTAKSIPLVGRQMARKPGTLANVNKAMAALNEAAGSPDLSLLPPAPGRASRSPPPPG